MNSYIIPRYRHMLGKMQKKKKRLQVYDKYIFKLKWVTKIGEVNY